MITIITFVLPSVLGIKLFMHFNRNKKNIDLIMFFLIFVLFSNFITMILANIISNNIYNIEEYVNNNLVFTIYYIFISLIVNVILSIIFTIIDKYLVFDIEVENERKTKKRKSIKGN